MSIRSVQSGDGALSLPAALDMRGRKVLVTGAANGIGRKTAEVMGALGAELVLADRASLEETTAHLRAAGATFEVNEGDLTDDHFLNALAAKGPYFALAQVAGVFWPPQELSDRDAFDFVIHVNVRAPMLLASACIEQMSARREGRVVLVGSAAGRHGGTSLDGGREYATYAASKGGLHTLVRWLARRAVAGNVLVNGVAPGMVKTQMLASVTHKPDNLLIGRTGTVEELAWRIAFLCSPVASFISGVVLDVNGGALYRLEERAKP